MTFALTDGNDRAGRFGDVSFVFLCGFRHGDDTESDRVVVSVGAAAFALVVRAA